MRYCEAPDQCVGHPPPVIDQPTSARLIAGARPSSSHSGGNGGWMRPRRGRTLRAPALAGVLGLALLESTLHFVPARLLDGPAPLPPPQVVGWSEALLSATVGPSGTVTAIQMTRGTEPLAGLLRSAISSWRFAPATVDEAPTSSQVLVAAIYRPAMLYDTPAFGARPPSRSPAGSEQPLWPVTTSPPAYPPRARGDGVVIVEVLVRGNGEVQATSVAYSSGSGFNAAALEAASRWQFEPARWNGESVDARGYLVFGFREPVIGQS